MKSKLHNVSRPLIVLLPLIAFIAVLYLIPRNRHVPSKDTLASVVETAVVNKSAAVPGEEAKGQTPEDVRARREDVQREQAEKYEAAVRKLQTPIHFYGRVVDSEGKPVEGAQSSYVLANHLNWNGSPTFTGPKSARDGNFEINGTGLNISVQVEHPDYYTVERGGVQIQYNTFDGRQLPPPPTREKPTIFVLKRKGKIEPLIYHDRIVTEIPMNGQECSVDLRAGKSKKSAEAITFQLVSNYDAASPNQVRPFNWQLTLMVAGGVSPRKGTFDFVAPEHGYEPVVRVEAFANQPGWKGRLEQEFFLKFNSGTYARVKLLVGGNGYCVIESWLNPTGSRNLEFDPSKRIDPDRIAAVGLEKAIEEAKAREPGT